MRLQTTKPIGKPPLRTVTEIAEILGVSRAKLVGALRADDAPQPVMRGSEYDHTHGLGRVWYEPKAVIRWWRAKTAR